MEGSRARAWENPRRYALQARAREPLVLGSNFAKDKSNLLFGTVFFALVFFFLCWGQILGKYGPAGYIYMYITHIYAYVHILYYIYIIYIHYINKYIYIHYIYIYLQIYTYTYLYVLIHIQTYFQTSVF